MIIALYQINPERDNLRVMFESLESLEKLYGTNEIDPSIYGKMYEGEVDAGNLEDIYRIFNIEKPDGFEGRSMSVSDVVRTYDPETGEEKFFYCDSYGFQEIAFDENKASDRFNTKITVVMCEPGKVARVEEIGTSLEDLQRAVGGLIEPFYPFEEEVCIVCNDEGKLNGMRPCRAVFNDEGKVHDIICGPFFICDCSGMEFGSLSKDQIDRYLHRFELPEYYFRVDGEIKVIPYRPMQEIDHAR